MYSLVLELLTPLSRTHIYFPDPPGIARFIYFLYFALGTDILDGDPLGSLSISSNVRITLHYVAQVLWLHVVLWLCGSIDFAARTIKFFDNKFSNLLSAFRKGCSTQLSLIRVIEKWRKCLDSYGKVGAILMDLSKAFACLLNDLLIAKLEAYGFSANSLCLIYNYLKDRMQRVKIGSVKSSQQSLERESHRVLFWD